MIKSLYSDFQSCGHTVVRRDEPFPPLAGDGFGLSCSGGFSVGSNMISFVGRIWGNGEFGIARERSFNPERVTSPSADPGQRWRVTLFKVHGLWACLEYAGSDANQLNGGVFPVRGDLGSEQDTVARLDSSLLVNSHRADRGQKGISRYGGKLVRNGAFAMEQEFDKSRLTFLTLTLPNISAQEALDLTANWSDVVRIFCQRLKRFLRSRRLPGEIVGVTEVQEKRAMLTGVFALHLHLVFVGRKRGHAWVLSPSLVKSFWRDALSKYLHNPVKHYDWRAVENIQRVKSSASGYLGKYMSKGLKSVQKLRALYPDVHFPSSWYICTNALRKKVKSQQVRVSGELGTLLADICESGCGELVKYIKRVDISLSDGCTIPIGWSGRMTQEGRMMFFEYAQELRGGR